jgi:hypothetical protein
MQVMPTNLLDQSLLYEEYNKLSSFELCFHSQELVQDLVTKSSELIMQLRPLVYNLLSHDQNNYLLRKVKFEDSLKTLNVIIARLRTLGLIIHQRKQILDQDQHQQQLASYSASEEEPPLDQLKKEKEDLIEQLRTKNQYIKLAIDKILNIIWQINSVQTLKQ